MNWTGFLRRTSLLLGLLSIALAVWASMHAQHLLDNAGSRHAGETLVTIVLALVAFTGSWYGARQIKSL